MTISLDRLLEIQAALRIARREEHCGNVTGAEHVTLLCAESTVEFYVSKLSEKAGIEVAA